MIILKNSTTDKLQVTSSVSVNVDVVATWVDRSASTTFTDDRTVTAITNTTVTEVVATPASSTNRNVKEMTIRNKDASTSTNITVTFNNNGTSYELVKVLVNAGETLQYFNGRWFILGVGSGAQTAFEYKGSQKSMTAQTVTDIFTGLTVPIGTQWEVVANMALTPAAGTQGVQVGIQCSVAGATVEAKVIGPQTTTAEKSYRQNSQGAGTLPTQNVAGTQSVNLVGVITVPGSGSPIIGIQGKGVQASQAWTCETGSYLKITRMA